MTSPGEPYAGGRTAWVDTLRVVVIAGVVVAHTATAYVTDVADWYHDDELRPTTVGAVVAGMPALAGGVFGLGPLFWLAGYFTVRSLARRGPGDVARSRVVRLGVPLVVFAVLVNPLADLVGNLRDERLSFWGYLARTELSIMWFVAALLAFSLVYAAARHVRPARAGPLPGAGTAAAAALVVTVAALVVWPATSLLDERLMSVRLGAWPQGAALFALGVLTAERAGPAAGDGVVLGVDRRAERRYGAVAAVGLAAAAPLVAGADDGALEEVLAAAGWRGAAFAVAYGVVSVSFTLWCLAWFRRRWAGGGARTAWAGRASYATYLTHPLVLTALMVAVRPVPLAPEVKVLVVAAVGVPVCFLAGDGLTRLPGLRRVL